MRRRDFIRAGALGAGVLASPGVLAAPPVVEALARRVERRREQVHARLSPFRDALADLGIPGFDAALFDALLPGMLATVSYAEFSNLRVRHQRHPLAQKLIHGAAQDIGEALTRLASVYEALSDGDWQRLDASLTANDATVDAVVERALAEVADLDLPRRSLKQLEATFASLRLRMKREGLQGVLGDLVNDVRRLERTVASQDDPLDAVRAVTPTAAATELESEVDSDLDDGGDVLYEDVPGQGISSTHALGLLLLGVGLVGIVAIVVGAVATIGFGLLCICVSIPLIGGTVLVIVAGGSLVSD